MNKARKREVTPKNEEDPTQQTVGAGKENPKEEEKDPTKKEPTAYDSIRAGRAERTGMLFQTSLTAT